MSERENRARTAGEALRCVVVTRTGRLSGARLARAIGESRHELAGIVAEQRLTMVRNALRRKSPAALLRARGFGRAARLGIDLLAGRLRALLRADGEPSGGAGDARGIAARHDAPYAEVKALNSADAASLLRDWAPDVLVVANAPVLGADIFGIPRLMALNYHSGHLPDYGGVASEFWSLYEGCSAHWVTLHRVTEDLDAGGIMGERSLPITAEDTPERLYRRGLSVGAALLAEVLDRIAAGEHGVLRDPGTARLRPWPTPAQRRALTRRRRQTTKR